MNDDVSYSIIATNMFAIVVVLSPAHVMTVFVDYSALITNDHLPTMACHKFAKYS